MSSKNRVMFVTNSLSGGGAERATNILVNTLSDSGNQVSLVTINDGPRDLIEPKCKVFELKRKWQGGFLSVLSAYFKLQRTIWKWKPEYVVLNCDIPEFLGSLTVGKHKLIAVEHATYPWLNRIQLGKLTRRILTARDTKWVAVSDHLSIWEIQPIPDISICNATILSEIGRRPSRGVIKRLNYVGRLSREKQPLWALKIAEQTKLPIRIYGDGLLKSELQEYASKNKIESDFAGFVSNPWTFFEEGDLLIVPSSFEGDGLVLIEAMGNKVPVIANDIPDLRRFNLEDSNYAATIEEFCNLIIDNLTRIEHFLPNEAVVSKILKERDPIKVAKKWNDFLSSMA